MNVNQACVEAIKDIAKSASHERPIYVSTLIEKLSFSESIIRDNAKYLIQSNVIDGRVVPIDGQFEAAIYGLK